MPTEYELKFVLSDPTGELFGKLIAEHDSHHLEQFYLSDGARFRRSRRVPLGAAEADAASNIFCYKQKISGQVLEIETPVSDADYDLAHRAAKCELSKIRFKIPTSKGVWDIDYFLTKIDGTTDQLIYFVMAEYEHEKGSEVEVLDILQPYVAIAVPYNESHRYSSRKLCDTHYAMQVTNSISSGNRGGLPYWIRSRYD